MGPAGAVVYGENSLFGRRRHTTHMGNFRYRQDGRGSPIWRQTYLPFDLDTMELIMDAARFDALLRWLTAHASRRGVLTGLAVTVGLNPLLGVSGAKARRRKKKCRNCSACQTCRKGKCKSITDGTICEFGKTCRDGKCACNPGTSEIAGRCITACTDACRATVNCCHKTFDQGIEFCGRDHRPCETALPCTSHQGCSTGELCGTTRCPAVNGTTNKCVKLC